MNKQLHTKPPGPEGDHPLDKEYLSNGKYSTFLFEPTDFVSFDRALKWQQDWQTKLLKEPDLAQSVWFLQHYPCYTLGRGSSEEYLLFDQSQPPAKLFRIDRGGEVTHHLPGQLVVYLVLDLRRYKTDLNWYLRELEQVLIDLLELFEIEAYRIDGMTGVWCDEKKVGSIGIGCRRWITKHGLSLNVDCDLDGFEYIVPCGLKNKRVGRIIDWRRGLTIKEVKCKLKKILSQRFQLTWNKEIFE